jgi:hypothetical protein
MRLLRQAGMGLLMMTPLAWLIRLVRFGHRDAYRRLAEAYYQISPLEPRDTLPPLTQNRALIPLLATIPEIELTALVPHPPTVTLSAQLRLQEGAMPISDLLPFLSFFAELKPAEALEIGTFFGTTTAMLAMNSPATLIHTVDLPPDNRGDTQLAQDDFHLIRQRRLGEAFQLVPGSRIIQHLGDTATWDFGIASRATFAFIDGGHTYEYARNDTEKCLSHCSRPLTIVWHDCDLFHAGVVTWLAEMVAAGHPVHRIRDTALAVLMVK